MESIHDRINEMMKSHSHQFYTADADSTAEIIKLKTRLQAHDDLLAIVISHIASLEIQLQQQNLLK